MCAIIAGFGLYRIKVTPHINTSVGLDTCVSISVTAQTLIFKKSSGLCFSISVTPDSSNGSSNDQSTLSRDGSAVVVLTVVHTCPIQPRLNHYLISLHKKSIRILIRKAKRGSKLTYHIAISRQRGCCVKQDA